jgi:hypothetical protein
MADLTALWDWLPDALSSVASALTIIGILLITPVGFLIRWAIKRWRKTKFRQRRAQSKQLDQLTFGRPLEAVESMFGVPKYITRHYVTHEVSVEERYYRLPGAWVTVQAPDGVVRVFSVTITDEDMYYDTGPMTFGAIAIRLGRDTFADAPRSDDESLQIGARQVTFVRYYDYGCTAAGMLYCWLAFNNVGAGDGGGSEPYGTGTYSALGGQYGTPPDRSAITANTITVMSPEANPNDMRERWLHGPHHDLIRRG